METRCFTGFLLFDVIDMSIFHGLLYLLAFAFYYPLRPFRSFILSLWYIQPMFKCLFMAGRIA